jgi:hypothetical protein
MHASIAATNRASESRNAVLKSQFANIGKVQAQLDKLSETIPVDADMPVFLRELDDLTNQFQVVLGNVTVGNATKYVPSISASTPATTTGSSTPTPSPSASSGSAVPVVPVMPAGASARLLRVPVQIVVKGTYADVMAFVGALQGGSRLFLASAVSVSASPSDPNTFTGNIDGYVDALPLPVGVKLEAGSGANPTTTPVSTPSSSDSSPTSPTPSPSTTP